MAKPTSFAKSAQQTADRLDAFEQRFDAALARLEQQGAALEAALRKIEALRGAVFELSGAREQHLAHLAQLDLVISQDGTPVPIVITMKDLLRQAELERIVDLERRDLFLNYDDGPGDWELTEPAYLDGRSQRVVRQGRARVKRETSA